MGFVDKLIAFPGNFFGVWLGREESGKPKEVKGFGEVAYKREVWSWYLVDFAMSPYAQAGIGALILPYVVLLTSYTANGGEWPPENNSTLGNGIEECICVDNNSTGKVYPMGIELGPDAYSVFCTSISVALQVITFIFFGAMADVGNYRRTLFIIFNVLASILTMLFIATDVGLWEFAGTLLILSNTLFGLGTIFYNAYMPLLVKSHYKLVNAHQEGLLDDDLKKKEIRLGQRLSTFGFIVGYVGGVLVLVIAFLLFLTTGDGTNETVIN